VSVLSATPSRLFAQPDSGLERTGFALMFATRER
jgi:hypothetical protein